MGMMLRTHQLWGDAKWVSESMQRSPEATLILRLLSGLSRTLQVTARFLAALSRLPHLSLRVLIRMFNRFNLLQ